MRSPNFTTSNLFFGKFKKDEVCKTIRTLCNNVETTSAETFQQFQGKNSRE